MNVRDIVKKYLEAEGLDGLCNAAGDCACLRDDLAPCGDMGDDCEPGYRAPCNCGDDHDFHIVDVKPEAKPKTSGS